MNNVKKQYSASFKSKVIIEYLEEQSPVGKLCEKYELHPNVFYNWKKEFMENAIKIFEKRKEDGQEDPRIKQLENKLRAKEEVISEIIEDNIKLKKKLNGEK